MEHKEIDRMNEELMQHMLSLAEPKNWKKNSDMITESLKAFENDNWLKEIETVYLVGHGTSYATGKNGESWMAHIAGLQACAMPAFQFCSYAGDFLLKPEKTLVVGVSCSGNTASVVNSLKVAREKGAATVCLSGDGDIKMAEAAEYRITTDAHIESRVGVGAYSISHLFIAYGAYQLAVLLGSRNGRLDAADVAYWRQQMEKTIAAMAALPRLNEEMKAIAGKLNRDTMDNLAVLGTGPNMGTMVEGALKISEFCWLFGAGEELEDFAHGRFREVDERVPLFMLTPAGPSYDKTMDLLAGCAIAKSPAVVFTDVPTEPMKKLATYVVEMPKIEDEYLTPFLYIYPLWFYGWHIAAAEGQLVGDRRHGLFATDINFKAHFDEAGNKK